ncbi:MAG: fimbrial assembly protein [Rhodanobacteraceae bacterium]|nr:MAG: fimbrial assembly protein [Rhodanobacteraceae bacterium]
MAKINLLPWRAERRERRKREFFTHLGIAAVAAIVLVLLWGFWVSLRISNQNERNDYLKGQITQLDAKITEIANLQKVKDHLLARKRIVEKLQSSRSQMVHLFDQVVKTIPAGARLTALKQQGDKLTLDGVAQSNATVAEYMRNIEASPWMGPAQLVKTENVHTDSNTPYEFELVVTLGTPKSGDNGATPAAGSSSAAPATAASVAATPSSLAAAPKSAASTATLSATAPAASAHAAPVSAPASAVTATAAAKQADPKAPHASTASATKGGRP